MDGNFSLILNNDGETSLTVLAKGKQISLTLSGEVILEPHHEKTNNWLRRKQRRRSASR